MAIKLIGTDVPNTTVQPQPELGTPVQPEDSSKTALQVTSQGLQNTNELLARTNESNAQIALSIPKGTNQALGAIMEYDNKLAKQEEASLTRGFLTGGKELADTVSRFIEIDQRRQAAEAKQRADALKAQQDEEFFRLSSTVDEFSSKLQTSLRTNPGGLPEFERQFKELVNNNNILSAEQKAKLYSQFYGAVSPINAEQGRNLVDNQEKYLAVSRANKVEQAKLSAMPIIAALKYANDSTVRTENIKRLDTIYEQLMTDGSLSDFDRVTIITSIREQANVALRDSLDQGLEIKQKADNFTGFIRDANVIRQNYQSNKFTRADYEAQIGFAAQRYGIPDSIAKVYGANYDREQANRDMELLKQTRELEADAASAEVDAVPMTELLIGSIVASSRGDVNATRITAFPKGSTTRDRIEGVIKDANELYEARIQARQQNMLLQGDILRDKESFAKAIFSRVSGNSSVNQTMLVNMGLDIKNADILDAIKGQSATPQQIAEFRAELEAIHGRNASLIVERQTANNEKVRLLESRLRPYGLDQGFDKFPMDKFQAELKVNNQRVAERQRQRQQEQIRVNPNAAPGGQSNLFFKVPQLAKVQAGSKGQTFAPFKPGTKFVKTGEYLEQRPTHKHAGVDYAADEGTPIIAHIPMKVVKIEYNDGGYGHYVTTQGADGKFYRYAHLPARPRLNVGQNIDAGQAFAVVGNSGFSTGAHLHFEVLNRNTYGTTDTLDPIEYMKRFTPNSSPQLPRGQNYSQFYGSGQSTSTQRASIPKEAVPLGGGLFILKGQVYNKETLERVNQTRYSPAMPVRQQNNSSNKTSYKSDNRDANHGYAVIANDASFRRELNATAKRLGIPPVWLADVIADETGATFSKDIGNGLGHYGLIQFDEGAARGLGTTLSELKAMTPTQQLKYVEKYIRQRTNNGKWITSPHDLKAAIWYGNSSPETMRKLWSDPDGITDGLISWRAFANRLGRYAGRKYDSPLTRRERLQSRLRDDTPSLIASESAGLFMEVNT
ncbi:putative endopeptidase [Arthronema virus TR020]|uniref:Putative endopeptidase n=1 Tax=Arthronema virus TR020 TaxID=2736280 RepID=A0A7G5AWZ8_9CAUD|nr:putative endopeptidase [Arthronema virus TR020]